MDEPLEPLGKRFGLSFKDALVAVPTFHLVCTIAYLASYALGFGDGIGALYSVSDIANTAVRQMPLIYALGLVMLVFSTAVKKPEEEEYTGKWVFNWPTFMLFFGGSVLYPAMFAFVEWQSSIIHGEPYNFYNGGQILFGLPLFALALFVPKLGPFRKLISVILTVLFTMSLASFVGINAGHKDRYTVYADAASDRPICNSVAVLRGISDKFLVVRPNGTKAIYTADCKPFMDLPEPAWLRPQQHKL